MALAGLAVLVGACSSDDSAAPDGGDAATSDSATAAAYSTTASVPGVDNGHCAGKPAQAVSQTVCHLAPVATDAGGGADTDAAGQDDGMPDELPGQRGSEGDDDDCKYHVKWVSTAVTATGAVSLQATVTSKVDNTPVTGAGPYLEIFLNNTPAQSQGGAPGTNLGTEKPAGSGIYTFDNVVFGQPGQWTFRVHIWGTCDDGEESPHGHVAFLINVP